MVSSFKDNVEETNTCFSYVLKEQEGFPKWGNNGMMRLVPRLINEVKNLILEQELTIEEIQILWTLLTKRRVLEAMVY